MDPDVQTSFLALRATLGLVGHSQTSARQGIANLVGNTAELLLGAVALAASLGKSVGDGRKTRRRRVS